MHPGTFAHPILSCEQAKAVETNLLKDDSAAWSAMQAAGRGIARSVLEDFLELRPLPKPLALLILAGKGNNAGDALIAAARICERCDGVNVTVCLAEPKETLRPLARKALAEVRAANEVQLIEPPDEPSKASWLTLLHSAGGRLGWDVCLDGILGMAFTPPLRAAHAALISAVNEYPKIGLRAAVDLPSGLGEGANAVEGFLADFTYATGSLKIPALNAAKISGRLRYLDLGFFEKDLPESSVGLHVINENVLAPLRTLRRATSDKRTFGHLFVVGGSAYMPGALNMAVKAALRSGVGLVTAFAPASVAANLAAQLPEAMWIPWPETSNGTLSPKALPLLLDRVDRASAVLVGPGLGADRFTRMLCQELILRCSLPMVLDADALYPEIVEVIDRRKSEFGPLTLTPHHGEFERLARKTLTDGGLDLLREYSARHGVHVVLKGALTAVCSENSINFNLRGGPVLSRGGSGDMLAGILASLIAQKHSDYPSMLSAGVLWHGLAAEYLAREKGQVSISTSQLLDYLGAALRGGHAEK